MRWAVQETELLEVERGKAELGDIAPWCRWRARVEAPPWVIAHRDCLQSVVALVKAGAAAVPPAAGKSLRQALQALDVSASAQ